MKGLAASPLGLLLSFLITLFQFQFVYTSSHHQPRHAGFHKHYVRDNSTASSNMTLSEAQAIVSAAHAAMRTVNPQIFNNPQVNQYRASNSTEKELAKKPAPPLDYASNSTLSSIRKRWGARATGNLSAADNITSTGQSYSIPPELAQAARIVAEASSQSQSTSEARNLAAELRSKWLTNANDTNIPRQAIRKSDGLSGFVPGDLYQPVVASNASQADTSNAKRAATSFWMETIQQLGNAPYAPSGYKVWRNVKDYGAKGDGVTDDTAAINLAISDGGRCGSGCGSSTVYPATVYFPSGTYLVSSPIIQYYNTEMLGNPLDRPTILASSSFVGLGVVTSDVYIADNVGWYINTNNFLRSVKNFIIDITATDQSASVCGIHWQVAQASSLENIDFHMTDPADVPDTTQQGIYMENGSGGFLGNLVFTGGKFGAFFGNQQFTMSGLVFVNAQTAFQILWDWGWTMQNIIIADCTHGVVLTAAGGDGGTQGAGSVVFTDMIIENTQYGIWTAVMGDASTSFMLQNSAFFNVPSLVLDYQSGDTLLPGGSAWTTVDGWGFGKTTDASGNTQFQTAGDVAFMERDSSLVLNPGTGTNQGFFYTRRRPSYADLGNSQLFDVKAYGAKGDGSSRDDIVLNAILQTAANLSAIVYFPHGVYVLEDTLQIPVGSRIIGQAWPQLMAAGDKFGDMTHPYVAVSVGNEGDSGIVEIQGMMFSVRGPAPGAVLVEWNVHESTQGSAGLWDSHFRVGGAVSTNMQASQCQVSSTVNKNCIGASLMMHITPAASAYLENVWIWSADHDIDDPNQAQINVYTGRGLLIESQGPTWLWGTSVEHAILYQYQLTGAKNVVMGLIQTESPYYQPSPPAPEPFTTGSFASDPTFSDCPSTDLQCRMAWAARIVDSSTVYVLSTGLYSWFQNYDKTCVNDDAGDCQTRVFEAVQSTYLWIYNLITVGSVEMISPLNTAPILAADKKNGYASTILAWFEGANQTTGATNFTGYQLYTSNFSPSLQVSSTCQTALTATIYCDNYTKSLTQAKSFGSPGNQTYTDQVCDSTCFSSIATWVNNVDAFCTDLTWYGNAPVAILGMQIWYGLNETCLKDTNTGEYCNDVFESFTIQGNYDELPTNELCSACYVGQLQLMQSSAYSVYVKDKWFTEALAYVNTHCSTGSPTSSQAVLITPTPTPTPICVSGQTYTARVGDTCDDIAIKMNVSSAALFNSNSNIINCANLTSGTMLCMPLTCSTYSLQDSDSCVSIAIAEDIQTTDLRTYNPWIDISCSNLHTYNATYGNILCLSAPGGVYTPGVSTNTSVQPGTTSGQFDVALPVPDGATVATGTDTSDCGAWYTALANDTCATICIYSGITVTVLAELNPSVNTTNCAASISAGTTYCVGSVISDTVQEIDFSDRGCWATSTGTGLPLSNAVQLVNTTLDASACVAYCKTQANVTTAGTGIGLAGLLGGNTCICAAQLSLNVQNVIDTDCATPCAGEESTNTQCGGSAAVEVLVYSTSGDGISAYLPQEIEYYGCYADASGNNVGSEDVLTFSWMTRDVCRANCLPQYPLYALGNGTTCYCGSALGSGTVLAASDDLCDTPCGGDNSTTCGGGIYLDLFGTFSTTNTTTVNITTTSTTSTTIKTSTTSSTSTQATTTTTSSSTKSSTTSSATSSTTSKTTTTTTTTSSTSSIVTPTPTQANMATNCNKFYLVASGDTCAKIATAQGISLSQFYSWNPAVGSTCATLGLNDYVCIGVVSTCVADSSGLVSPTPSGAVCGVVSLSNGGTTISLSTLFAQPVL